MQENTRMYDHRLRDLGVGDKGIVRHIKRVLGAFYEHSANYEKGFDTG